MSGICFWEGEVLPTTEIKNAAELAVTPDDYNQDDDHDHDHDDAYDDHDDADDHEDDELLICHKISIN